MGSAFVAIADDATAASWNPGGLTQLERPELSVVYSTKFFSENFDSTRFLRSDDDTFNRQFEDLNFFSVVYPIPRTIGGRNLVIGLTFQKKLDFDRTLDFTATQNLGISGGAIGIRIDTKYSQEGSLSTLSPAVGFELTDKLSVGVAMNIWDSSILSSNRWKTRNRFKIRGALNAGIPIFTQGEITEDFTDYRATNYTLGLLYKPNDRWSVGFTYHTKYRADVRSKKVTRTIFSSAGGSFPTSIRRTRLEFEWPEAISVGVAYRFPNDKLTLAFDVSYRDWSDFIKIDKSKALGSRRVSGVTGMAPGRNQIDPTWTVRAGFEYVFVNEKKPKQDYLPSIRGGIFYDPQPASGRRDGLFGTGKGNGDPDDYYGVTAGVGVLIKNRTNIDLAYQFRWGTNVNRDTFAGSGVFETGFSEDIYQHSLFLSSVIYF